MPRALHGDEWHPLIPSPLGERVRVRGGRQTGIHPHLNPPPQGGGDIFFKILAAPTFGRGVSLYQ